jgi:hypothetical protein
MITETPTALKRSGGLNIYFVMFIAELLPDLNRANALEPAADGTCPKGTKTPMHSRASMLKKMKARR